MTKLYSPIPKSTLAADVFNMGTQLQNLKLQQGQLDLQREQARQQARAGGIAEKTFQAEYGEGGLQQRGMAVSEQQAQTAALMAQREVPLPMRPMGAGDIAKMEAKAPIVDAKLGFSFSKSAVPYMNQVKAWSEQGLSRYEIYQITKQPEHWEQFKQPFIEGASKAMKEAVTQGDTKRVETLSQAITAFNSPEFAQHFFPASALYEKNLQAEREQALAQKGDKLYETVEGWQPQSQAVGKLKPQSGMVIESTPEGGFSVRTGVPQGQGSMTRPTQTTLQQGAMDIMAGAERLNQVARSFKPEFLELGTKWTALKSRWKEKLKGTAVEKMANLDVSPQDKATLKEFTGFRRNAIDNINRYIKEITGAQMSEKEADRLRKAVPDPGESFFEGDSPTEFKSKMEQLRQTFRMSMARHTYLLKQGLTDAAMSKLIKSDALPSLDSMPAIIQQRDQEIEEEIKSANPGINKNELDKMVMNLLSEEFGLRL